MVGGSVGTIHTAPDSPQFASETHCTEPPKKKKRLAASKTQSKTTLALWEAITRTTRKVQTFLVATLDGHI